MMRTAVRRKLLRGPGAPSGSTVAELIRYSGLPAFTLRRCW